MSSVAIMRERWSDIVERDPYYNPNLSRERADFLVRQVDATVCVEMNSAKRICGRHQSSCTDALSTRN